MSGFRNFFVQAFHSTGKLFPFELLIRITGQRVIVPVYHTISDEDLPHIKHLYPVKGVSKFKEDLDFLLKQYTPIDFFELKKIILDNLPLKKKCFLLTFDDGLSEFHDVIAPILQQKGVPAVCFLNSDFMDNKNLFFRYKASLLVEHIEKNKSRLQHEKVKNWFYDYGGEPKNFKSVLLSIPYRQKETLDELASVLELDFKEWLKNQKPYLTSEQIASLIQDGFHFGAHSKDHPEYRFLDFEQQIQQTEQSINFICSRFSLNYKLFAFPFTDFGVSRKFFEAMKEKRLVDLSFGCAGLKQDVFPWQIQRVPLEMAHLSAKEILHSEYLYFMLKFPVGKNKIIRG